MTKKGPDEKKPGGGKPGACLLQVFRAEERRRRRGLAENQIVVLRASDQESSIPALREALALEAMECDSIVELDQETCALHLPSASQRWAEGCLKKALARLSLPGVKSLLVSLPQDIWETHTPQKVLNLILEELAREPEADSDCPQKRRLSLHKGLPEDEARVSAQERSFLLSAF